MANVKGDRDHPLKQAVHSVRSAFRSAALFSAAINILMLTGPVFMLQVYDRVLASRSVPTLVAIAGLAAGMYLFLGLFEFIRARVLSRAGYRLEQRLSSPLFNHYVAAGASSARETARPLQELAVLRQFLTSPGFTGLFDLPWVPFYLAIVFLLHPWLGLLALGGAAMVFIFALANEMMSREALSRAMLLEYSEAQLADASHRHGEALMAMGMTGHVERRWRRVHDEAGWNAQKGGERAEVFASASKATRLLLQSSILGLGSYLAILQEITPGMIIAGSIVAGRALAPVDVTIGQWRAIKRARGAYGRLKSILQAAKEEAETTELPEPEGRLQVEGITIFASSEPGAERRPILAQVSFALDPGDALGVIGASAAGKTTLARALTGVRVPDAGAVRLDGARLDHWEREALGRHVGYLPQNVELLSGSVRDNIARFDDTASDEEVIAAARMAGVHDLILRLPDGYATLTGLGARTILSGGQIQRIALARAVFRAPKLVVLDEPNSNLDAEGDAALAGAIEALRASGSTVVVMAHRPSAIAAVNKVLMLANGMVAEFGEKAEVLQKVTRRG